MHPVSYLFEDVYRDDWRIASATASEKRRGRSSPCGARHTCLCSASAAEPRSFL
jgi:hypothetical protein